MYGLGSARTGDDERTEWVSTLGNGSWKLDADQRQLGGTVICAKCNIATRQDNR